MAKTDNCSAISKHPPSMSIESSIEWICEPGVKIYKSYAFFNYHMLSRTLSNPRNRSGDVLLFTWDGLCRFPFQFWLQAAISFESRTSLFLDISTIIKSSVLWQDEDESSGRFALHWSSTAVSVPVRRIRSKPIAVPRSFSKYYI